MTMAGLILLSDIHANLSALESVISHFTRHYQAEGVILLGDIINYGMRPREVMSCLASLKLPILASIRGNHEQGIFDGDTKEFSTDRGRRALDFTRRMLGESGMRQLERMCAPTGTSELTIAGKRILLVHGSLDNPYWGKLTRENVPAEMYQDYDYVLSGHSHIPHLFEMMYPAERPLYRNRRRTVFVNPGSVGQPRNHNPRAQYAYLDIAADTVHFNSVEYDIDLEQSLYTPDIDPFYRERLTRGI